MLVSLKEVLEVAAKEAQVAVAGVEVRSDKYYLVYFLVHLSTLRRQLEEYCLADPCQCPARLLEHQELLRKKDPPAMVGLLAGRYVSLLEPPASSRLDHHGAPLYHPSCTHIAPISPCS